VHRVAVCDPGELAAAGIAAHVAEPANIAAARARKRHAKTDKTDSAHLRRLLAKGRLPECWIPPEHILEYRALLETYHYLRREHTAWVQRIHAVFFHQGVPRLGEDALRTEPGLARVRAAAAAHLSAAGQQQVATALDMLAATPDRMGPLRHQLADAARHLTGAKVLAERLYGVGQPGKTTRCARPHRLTASRSLTALQQPQDAGQA
jgi:hypothetical protein